MKQFFHSHGILLAPKTFECKKNNVSDNSVLVLLHLKAKSSYSVGVFSKGHCLTNTNFNSFPFCAPKTFVQILDLYINSKIHIKTVCKAKDTIKLF